MERKGDILAHRWRAWRTRGVTGGGRFNAMGKSHINDIDKERCGKESDSIIFIVRVREEVWAVGEGVRAH